MLKQELKQWVNSWPERNGLGSWYLIRHRFEGLGLLCLGLAGLVVVMLLWLMLITIF